MEDNLSVIQRKLVIGINGTTAWRPKRVSLNLLSRNGQVLESINSSKGYHETNCHQQEYVVIRKCYCLEKINCHACDPYNVVQKQM